MVAKGAVLSFVDHENHVGCELPVKAIDKDGITSLAENPHYDTVSIEFSNSKFSSSSGLRDAIDKDANIVSRLLIPMRSNFRRFFLGGREIYKLVHTDRMPQA